MAAYKKNNQQLLFEQIHIHKIKLHQNVADMRYIKKKYIQEEKYESVRICNKYIQLNLEFYITLDWLLGILPESGVGLTSRIYFDFITKHKLKINGIKLAFQKQHDAQPSIKY